MPLFIVFLHCIVSFFPTSAFDSLNTSMCTASGQRLVTWMYVRIKSTIGYQSCPLSSNGVCLATLASSVAPICLTNYICLCFTSDDSFLFLFSPSTLANSHLTLFFRHISTELELHDRICVMASLFLPCLPFLSSVSPTVTTFNKIEASVGMRF